MPNSSSSSASISAVSAARNRVGLLALPPKTDVTGGTTTPEFDLVAVHGLNGGRWSTWTRTEDKKETMWLQDLLPIKLPKARVMTFGYNANVVNNFSSFGIREHARTLLTRLKTKRDKLNGRPIVFVCHSLGGIVVKQALRLANNEKAFDDIAQSTRGILFFGTPHRGADLAFWGDIIAKIAKTVFLNPKRELIKDLKTNSQPLVQVSEDFRPIADKYKIVSFFEEDGILGTSNLVVPRSSALLEIPNEIPVPFEGNHMDICRFGADDEDRFDEVWIAIRDIVGESTQGRSEDE
ncbi:Alpha/Beta hydrolase protein [Paraphoma chrysanthemicola]|uniref:Alpha/Beta hydrolase protein n=1 Tax=Paraphoma chrysanthemicola TaxID=798071 RepID=A0A8K0QUP9_9PLEO|nr:Alpha/Beta hydrolase protein [Paraphoma chrysanthemicola]